MGRKGLEIVDVENAIKQLQREGQSVTTRAIRDITKTGSYLTITKYRKEIEQEQNNEKEEIQEKIEELKNEIKSLKIYILDKIKIIKEEEKKRKKVNENKTILQKIIDDIQENVLLPKKEQKPNAFFAEKYGIKSKEVKSVKKLLLM